ncbi:MAG: PAS domain S-box protein [Elusimicrobia bacterium]|nr:PAS domain S-box protein [Elusimicrobiota bacterium]MDE2424422.1 PAS domain S-box protein [Elusimicrobiota bacterium]
MKPRNQARSVRKRSTRPSRPAVLDHREARLTPDFYRRLIDSLSDYATITTDSDLRITSWSSGAVTIFGYKESEIIGEHISRLFTPEDKAAGIVKQEFDTAFDKGRVDDERWHIRKDGRRLWCYGLSFPLKTPEGTFRGFVKLIRDDTPRKRKDEALSASEERLRLAAEATGLGTWDYDVETDALFLSERAQRLLGVESSTQTGFEQFFERIAAENRPGISEGLHRCWSKEWDGSVPFDYAITLPDGAIRWVRTRAKGVFKSKDGDKPFRIVGTVMDITAQKLAQAESEKRTSDLQALNKELETFAHSASHDLRAPLRKIDAFSQIIMQRGKLDEEDRSYFARIRAATGRLQEIIDGILTLARVKEQPVALSDFDLSEVARQIAAEMREPSRKAAFVIAPGVRVHGDRRLLTIALHNLLDNAWKYTCKRSGARIEFGSKVLDGRTVYFVRDNGVGFDMRFVGTLFKAFQRLHSDPDFPGIGLGLEVVERIIGRHHGRVWAESRVNEGATFYFTLGTEGA